MFIRIRSLIFLVIMTHASAAVNQDPDSILEKHNAAFERLTSASDFVATLNEVNKIVGPEFGLTQSLISFISDLADGGYIQEIETIMSIPEQRWNATVGWGRYEIHYARRVVTQYRGVKAYDSMSTKLGNVCKTLAAISIVNDCIRGLQGDDLAKLSALGNTAKLVQGELISQYGTKGLKIAMLSVAFLDYTLTKFISDVHADYEKMWWKAYSNYMNTHYFSPLEWAQLAEREGMEAVERRLYEFWNNAKTNLSKYAFNDGPLPPFYSDIAGVYLEKYSKSFAARYYKENVYTTLKTYFTLEAEKAKANLELEFRRMDKLVAEFVKDMEAFKDLVENAPEDLESEAEDSTGEEVRIGSLADSLTMIADQVAAGYGKIDEKVGTCLTSLDPCQTRLAEALAELNGLIGEVSAWQTEVDREPSSPTAGSSLGSELQAKGRAVAQARDKAEEYALKACEETLWLKQNFSESAKTARLPGIRAAVNVANMSARRARETHQAMLRLLGDVSTSDDSRADLDSQRRDYLTRIPDVAGCDEVLRAAQAALATLISECQTLHMLERNALGIMEQARAHADAELEDGEGRLKQRLKKMKTRAAWMAKKSQMEGYLGAIKAQVQTATARITALQSRAEKVHTSLLEVHSQRADLLQKLEKPLATGGDASQLADFRALVDAAELFVEPAESAANQAFVCQMEAEAMQPGGSQPESQDSGFVDGGSTSGSGDSAVIGDATSMGRGVADAAGAASVAGWGEPTANTSDAWDAAAQRGTESGSSAGRAIGNAVETRSGDGDSWIKAAKDAANPPSCRYELALQYLQRARQENPGHSELNGLEIRVLKLRNEQACAEGYLAQAAQALQAGQLDAALRAAQTAISEGTWCERTRAEDLISYIQNQMTRTSVNAQRQRDAERNAAMAKSLISSLTTIQNTLIDAESGRSPGGSASGMGAGSSTAGGSTSSSTSGGGPFCSLTITHRPDGEYWVLFAQHVGGGVNYMLMEWADDDENRHALTPQQYAQELSQQGGGVDFRLVGQGSETAMRRKFDELCPNPASVQSY